MDNCSLCGMEFEYETNGQGYFCLNCDTNEPPVFTIILVPEPLPEDSYWLTEPEAEEPDPI